jgi:hypothetical protein
MTHYIQTSVNATGLLPQQDYTFKFRGLGGNWPAQIIPLSGSFTADSSAKTLNAIVNFCANTGLCPPSRPDILPYSLTEIANDTLTTVIDAEITNTCEHTKIVSSPAVVVASGFSPLSVIMPVSSSSGVDITLENDNYYYFSPVVTGMIPGETYEYTINSVGGNWPVLCWPNSGVVSSSKGYEAIDVAVSFCPKLSYCGPGTPNLLYNYNLTNDFSASYAPNNYFTILNISVKQTNYPYSNIVSDQLSIRCKNCLPVPTPTPTVTPTVTPSSRAGFDTYIIIANSSTLVNSAASITLAASYFDKLEFNQLSGSSTPAIMNLYIGLTQVASVTYPGTIYNNKSFAFTLNSTGQKYFGVFKEGSVTLN